MDAIEQKRHADVLRKQLIKRLQDLTNKIDFNEALPEKEQDLNLLFEISEKIEECLNNWYY